MIIKAQSLLLFHVMQRFVVFDGDEMEFNK